MCVGTNPHPGRRPLRRVCSEARPRSRIHAAASLVARARPTAVARRGCAAGAAAATGAGRIRVRRWGFDVYRTHMWVEGFNQCSEDEMGQIVDAQETTQYVF